MLLPYIVALKWPCTEIIFELSAKIVVLAFVERGDIPFHFYGLNGHAIPLANLNELQNVNMHFPPSQRSQIFKQIFSSVSLFVLPNSCKPFCVFNIRVLCFNGTIMAVAS